MWHGTVPFGEGERLTVAFDVRPPIWRCGPSIPGIALRLGAGTVATDLTSGSFCSVCYWYNLEFAPEEARVRRQDLMRQLIFATAAALMLSPAVAAPAFAQSAPAPQQQNAKPAEDPNQIVCEKQEDTGSRLAQHRICKTRAEWAEDKRNDRQEIEQIQQTRGCTKNGCWTVPRPSRGDRMVLIRWDG
jgi:hypothetical protein